MKVVETSLKERELELASIKEAKAAAEKKLRGQIDDLASDVRRLTTELHDALAGKAAEGKRKTALEMEVGRLS